MRVLYLFYNIFHNKVPKVIHSLILSMRTSTRQPNTFSSFYCRTMYFQNSVLLCIIREWNKPNPDKRSFLSWNSFHKALLSFVRLSENKILNTHDQVGIKLITWLRLGFSHLREHKFWHKFEDILNLWWSCNNEVKTTLHFFLKRCYMEVILLTTMEIVRF